MDRKELLARYNDLRDVSRRIGSDLIGVRRTVPDGALVEDPDTEALFADLVRERLAVIEAELVATPAPAEAWPGRPSMGMGGIRYGAPPPPESR